MKLKYHLSWLFVCVLVLSISSGTLAAPPMQEPTPVPEEGKAFPPEIQALDHETVAKIEPLVVEELTRADQVDFFVWMADKADLRPAYQLKTKEEKGRFVLDTLRQTAERSQAALRQALDDQAVDYRPFYIANKILVQGGNAALLASTAARADVARITANHQFQLEEPSIDLNAPARTLAVEANLSFVNADDVWALGYDGRGTVLAGNDTGLDWDHPALINQYRGWDGVTANHNYNWWDATGTYPTVPSDGHGHGTHTTGTMVGDDGGANQIGMAPGARTVHCKNMTDWGSGSDATITECFEWDLAPWDLNGTNPRPDLAPDAINNSWGYSGGSYPAFEDEIAALQAAGIVVEFSAGNSGPYCTTLGSPGDYRQSLTTGSVGHAGGSLPGTLTSFSSRGPSNLYPADYMPDVMAPGENIRSSVPGGSYQGGWSGTSMSGPHVTGLIGLMWSANPGLQGMVTETVHIILDTPVPLTGQTGSNCGGDYAAGPNNDWGYGTIDALAAVQQAMLYGDSGTLAGTVTDELSLASVPGATIQATLSPTLTWQTTSDALGAYSMHVFSGTFTVIAVAYGYQPESMADVSITSGTTTTLAISLTPAPTYVVSGTVTDANAGWPLYASIDVDGYPGDTVWTDPVTGYYSITLAAGISYIFNVNAWPPGYNTVNRTVGPLTGDRSENLSLDVDPAACTAPGYSPTYAYLEDFDTDGGYTHSGTQDEWEWGMPAIWPNHCSSGANCWGTDLDSNYQDYASQELVSTLIDLSSVPVGTALTARWRQAWAIESSWYDHAYVEVSINGGPWTEMWSHSGGTTQVDWTEMAHDISSAAGGNVQFRWRLTSNSSIAYEGLYIDDVAIMTGCGSMPGGLVVGNVYDANTGDALNGASLSNDSGGSTITSATPDDPAVEDGFYTLFSPAGTHVFTATLGGYGADVQRPIVVQNDTIRQDFDLAMARLSHTPPTLEATLDMGARVTVPFTLTNSGGAAATFELQERDKGFHIVWMTTGPFANPRPLVPPEYQEKASTEGLELPFAPTSDVLAAGDVIQSWPSGLGTAWGVAYDGNDDTVWVGLGWNATNTIYEYQPDGTLTGRSHSYPWSPTYGPADSAFNWNTGMVWTLDVGGDNCLHEMAPATGYTGNTICGPWGISQRGVAYDPTTDTWYVGGWNEETVYHIDSSGTLLDSALVSLTISGLAYNPDTQHLFVQINGGTNDVYVLDASQTGVYPQIGHFHIGTLASGAGLEIDCQGNLWAIDQGNEMVYQVESGEAASVCSQDVAWLFKDPVTGTVASSASQVVTITFDAGVPEIAQPGQYYAELRIKNDTPYDLPTVPLTMTVTAPATWGKLTGTVRGLGYCNANPAPLEDATLLIEGSTGVTWTLASDANGAYQLWLDQAHSPLTVTAMHPDHEPSQVTGVSVTAQMTATQDVSLRWLQPCLGLAPPALSARVTISGVATRTLTLSNQGALMSNWRLAEADGGFAPTHLSPAGPLHVGGQARVIVENKEDDSTSLDNAPLPLASGGPDPFGYTYHDSTEANGPVYQWIEIAPPAGGNGLEISGLTGVDDGYFWPLSLPFPLNFYGTDYDQLAVATNGTLYFEDDYLGYFNAPIPGSNSHGVERFIAHLWDDLVVDPGAVYYQAMGSMLVIEYYQVRGYATSGSGSWEVILFANGNILFQYQDATIGGFRDYGSSATVGIQGDTATGLPYSYNTPALFDGLAICFAYPGQSPNCSPDVPWLSENPTTGSVGADNAQTIDVILGASAPEVTQPGEYYATLTVQTDDPVRPWLQVPVTMTVTSYGVKVTPATDAKSGDPNATVTYRLHITNTGLQADTFDIAVSGNNWSTTAPTQLGPLAAGAGANVDVTVTLPAFVTGGTTDVAIVTVTSQGDDSQSATATLTTMANNIYAVHVVPSAQADSGGPGAVVTYTLQITNAGNTTDTFAIAARGNAWPTAVPVEAGPSDVEIRVGPLAAGASDTIDILVAIPPEALLGATDVATLTITSQSDDAQSATATLTTTVKRPPACILFLPIVAK